MGLEVSPACPSGKSLLTESASLYKVRLVYFKYLKKRDYYPFRP